MQLAQSLWMFRAAFAPCSEHFIHTWLHLLPLGCCSIWSMIHLEESLLKVCFHTIHQKTSETWADVNQCGITVIPMRRYKDARL